MSEKNSNKPLAKFGSVTVWPSQFGASVTMQKRYKDKNDVWQNGNSFYDRDIGPLLADLIQALTFIGTLPKPERKKRTGDMTGFEDAKDGSLSPDGKANGAADDNPEWDEHGI